MRRKFLYLASILPAALLCTQLIACTLDGSIYRSQPATPAGSATNGGSVISTKGGETTGKIHSAPLIKAAQPSSDITPVAPCNTLQLPGKTVQPTFTKHTSKILPLPVPTTHCQSANGKAILPGNVKIQNKRQLPGNTLTIPQVPGSISIPQQVPVKTSSPIKGKVSTQLPGHRKVPGMSPNTTNPDSAIPSQKPLHLFKKSGIVLNSVEQGSIIAYSLFNLINRDRVSAQLPALRWSDALARSAALHNLMMAHFDLLAHQLPNEPPVGIRENEEGVSWNWYGENIAFNSDETLGGAIAIYNEMMAERPPDDGHRQNILSPQSNTVGIDVLLDPITQKMWMTEDFAGIR